jgi:hypothetical protein
MKHRIAGRILATALSMALAACATTASDVRLIERLDEHTGITVTTLNRPLEFFAPQPEQGLDAASFADLGLAETNRMGARAYYLWASVLWGRTDLTRLQSPELATMTVEIDDASLTFEVTKRVDPPARVTLYAPPADWSEQIVFPLTPGEVRAIAHAQTLALMFVTQAGDRHRFTLWKPPTETLPRFADELLDGVAETH